jgi:hypothetical protein
VRAGLHEKIRVYMCIGVCVCGCVGGLHGEFLCALRECMCVYVCARVCVYVCRVGV